MVAEIEIEVRGYFQLVRDRPESVKGRRIGSFSHSRPSLTPPLARGTIGKMLEDLGRSDFKDSIMASMISF